jgi:hypothetical protein
MLRNGIMDKFDADGQQLDAKFSISYVGGLYGGRRDPSVVFEQVADLIDSGDIKREHIALVYAGREGAVYEAIAKRYGLQDLVDDRGTVTFAHSQEIQRSAHINLMISWASSSMSTFPAKFYEYINARRPILLLVLGSKDPEFEAIFSAKQIGDMFYDHQGATLRDSLLSSYHTYSEVGEVAYQGTEADVEEFYWQESFVAFDKYLQTLSQKV